jgi:4-hydroxy-tetrahydrodipicolinate synthase
VKLSHETLVTLGGHELVVAVKDATGDFSAGAWVMAETDLAYYSGDDAANLSWLAYGAVGFVSVVAHVATPRVRRHGRRRRPGRPGRGPPINTSLLPPYARS